MKRVITLLLVMCLVFALVAGCAAPASEPVSEQVKDPVSQPISAPTGIYTPGEYLVKSNGFGGPIEMAVEVDANSILSVEVLSNSETVGIGSNAIDQLPDAFIAKNSAQVDIVSGATITSNAMIEAVTSALNQAMGLDAGKAVMADGVYEGSGPAYRGAMRLSVTVQGGKVANVEVLESTDTPMIGGEACKLLSDAVIETQSLGVDTIAGATVSSNGFISAMSEALSKSGADVAALKVIPIEKRAAETAEYSSDILVIGAGMAGLTAAIEAADLGASVILIEKLGILGGSTTRSEGYVMGAGTEFQKANGVEGDTVEKFYQDIYSVYQIEPMLNKNLLKKITYESTSLINFLEDNEVEFAKIAAVSTFEPRATPRNHCTEGKGGGLTKALLDSAKKKGVTIYMNTSATEILKQDGVVTGAKATNQYGDDITFKAAATILCAGSYGGSEEMMKELNPKITAESVKGCGNGDGFKLAQSAGAQMLMLDYPQLQYYFFWEGVPDLPVYPASAIRPVPNILLTDGVGKRVANESDFNFEFIEKVFYSGQQEGYCIVGRKFYEQYPEVCEAGLGKTFPVRGDEIAFKADTVNELAAWAGLDAATLQATVDRYNELCDIGVDKDFNKNSEYMERIDAPYYMLKLPAVVTDGYTGAKINADAQVIDVNGNPIPGFYAAGSCAVPEVSCVNYYGCGTSLVTGGVFGRAAAKHAIAEISK